MQGSKMLELLGHFHGTELFFIMEENHRNLTRHIEMMASKREADNSVLIHNIKRMRICWNSILREERGNDCFRSISNKQPYTKWLTLGIGPCRSEDGSGSSKDPHGKGKAIADSGSRDVYNNQLTLKVGLCIEDGSNKHNYAMNGDKGAEKKGETSSNREDGRDERIEGEEESISVHHIPEDVLNKIFCKLPLHTLFQIQIVSTPWKSIISSSSYFHNLWEQNNGQSWLVMELRDETSGCSNGLALYDISRRLRYMKLFGEEWSYNSQWFLRAADGGLLVYSCRRNGKIRVFNPLTMQSCCLEDAKVTRKSRISFYLKKFHDDVAVHLKCDPKEKTYQVIAIIGNLYLLRRKLFVVLIYRSEEQKWEIREVRLEERVSGHMTISFFPSIFMQNQNIYWFSRKGIEAGNYDLNGDGNIRFLYFRGVKPIHETIGIVMYKGKLIMACKGEQMELPPYTHPIIFYELDELERQWEPKHEGILSPKDFISGTICIVEDYIWIIEESDGHVSHLICIDLETGELKVWPEVYPFMFNVRKCLSTPLSFCGCS